MNVLEEKMMLPELPNKLSVLINLQMNLSEWNIMLTIMLLSPAVP